MLMGKLLFLIYLTQQTDLQFAPNFYMAKYKGIIFDIDGTLTSTFELIFASFNYVMNKYLNKNLSNEEILNYFGPTEDQIMDELCGENAEKAKEDYYNFYTENHHIAKLYPGIKELLEFIKSKKVFLSIFTGKGRKAAAITLKKLEISKYFDLMITGDEVKEHKPSPEGIELFLNKFNLPKNKVLMIGDAPSDIKAAKAAGVEVASVLWDSYSKNEVMKLKSDYFFHSVEELSEFIRQNI
jgi:HAD superfamily hydrolase (TIGR01549 family)